MSGMTENEPEMPGTGIEPLAIKGASAVVRSAAKALEDDEKEVEALRRLAEQSGDLEPAARIYAKRVAVKQHIRLQLVRPLARLLGAPRDYFNSQFEDDMADRMADVPEEEIVTPRSSVAGPAMLGLGFTLEEPQLKAMFLNLLAAASDRRVQDSAHPSFAEVIKQLSASEAESLAAALRASPLPIIEIRRTADAPDEGYEIVATHVLDWTQDGQQVAAPERAMFVDNWVRLGLVIVDYGTSIAGAEKYSWAETAPLVATAREHYETDGVRRVHYQKGVLRATEFGRSFEQVVISSEPRALPAAKP
jgi:hypothetical protein